MADSPLVERIDAERVVVAQRIDTINFRDQPYDVAGCPNPYVGLDSFTYETRVRYAGREEQVRAAVDTLTRPGEEQVVLFVTGASGSGKSSFAQAGVIPALELYYRPSLPTGRRDDRAVFRPRTRPLTALARALAALGLPDASGGQDLLSTWATAAAFNEWLIRHNPPGQVNLIVIDQLEEVLSPTCESAQRHTFFTILAGIAPFQDVRTHLITTIRYDYLPVLMDQAQLSSVIQPQQVATLWAMSPTQLARAIRQPLAEQNSRLGDGKQWQPELVDRLAADATVDATFLPLLQVTLQQIWDTGRLTLDRYTSLTDALREKAEDAYETNRQGTAPRPRTKAEQTALMALLLDLVQVSLLT
jgi:hypothetical protein